MEEKKLKELLNQLKEYDIKKNNEKYTSVIKEIIEQIKNSEDNEKINIISKVYSDEEQSNYIKMYFFNELLKSHILNNKETKKKCYKLLIDSFNNNTAKDHIEQISKIKELFGKKDDLSDFEEIDMYIELFIAENENKHDLVNFNEDNTDRDLFDKIDNKKINLDIKIPDNKDIIENMDGKDLYLKTNSPSIGLTKNNYFDFNNNILEEINNNNMSDSNMGGNEKKVIKKYKPNSTLPMIIISVSVNLNAYQFLILINQTFKKFNYNNISTIRENEYENLSIYQYVPKNCFDYISEFINNKGKCIRNQFHVHASLKRDENNFNSGINSVLKDIYERKIAIRSVKGIESNIIKFMIQFLKTFCQSVDRIKIIKQSNCFLKYNLEKELNDIIEKETNIKMKSKLFNFRNKKFKYKKLKSEDDSMIGLNTSNKSLNTHINETDSFKYLEIIQILSKSEYGLGEKISSFIEEFKKKYNPPVKNVENINTREIMTDIIKLFDFCITNLNTSFNNKNNKYETNYISLASEQYIFNKIYFILFGIYCEKYKEENKKFLLIQKEINENLTNIDICNKLQVQSIYLGKEKFPFKTVINIINQITFEKFLHKKYEILTQASLEIRKCILEYTDGKFELESMDDELPIIIFISTQVKVDNLLAELNMIDDYIKCSMRDYLVQNKMVTNLLSSLMYLSKSWNSKTLSFD
jgi:hypothetical protein